MSYQLVKDAFVTLTIYDMNGYEVRWIELEYQIAAVYERREMARKTLIFENLLYR